jgi:hypothetical protein
MPPKASPGGPNAITEILDKARLNCRLRVHELIKKAGHCYTYYLTALGKQAVALGLKLKQLVIIPDLAAPAVSR